MGESLLSAWSLDSGRTHGADQTACSGSPFLWPHLRHPLAPPSWVARLAGPRNSMIAGAAHLAPPKGERELFPPLFWVGLWIILCGSYFLNSPLWSWAIRTALWNKACLFCLTYIFCLKGPKKNLQIILRAKVLGLDPKTLKVNLHSFWCIHFNYKGRILSFWLLQFTQFLYVCGQQGPQTTVAILWLRNKE